MRLFLLPLFCVCVHVCSIGFLFTLQSGSIKVFHMATKVIFNTSVIEKKNLHVGLNDNLYFHNSRG